MILLVHAILVSFYGGLDARLDEKIVRGLFSLLTLYLKRRRPKKVNKLVLPPPKKNLSVKATTRKRRRRSVWARCWSWSWSRSTRSFTLTNTNQVDFLVNPFSSYRTESFSVSLYLETASLVLRVLKKKNQRFFPLNRKKRAKIGYEP